MVRIISTCNNIKIMPCVEGDRSDCQPEASSAEGNGGCRGLTICSVTLNTGHDCFYYTESLSFTYLVYLCTLGPFLICKTQRIEHELVHGFSNNSLSCKRMTTFSPLPLVSKQLVNVPFPLQNEFAAKYR